jgi:hypothetical protein
MPPVCHFAGALFNLAEGLIAGGEVFIPTARICHHALQQEQLVINRPAGYRLTHGRTDMFSPLLLVFTEMSERNGIQPKIGSKEFLDGFENPFLPSHSGRRAVRHFPIEVLCCHTVLSGHFPISAASHSALTIRKSVQHR